MRNWIRIISVVTLALLGNQAMAVEANAHDTVYFYKSWEQMLDMVPDAYVVDPMIYFDSPYDIEILINDNQLDESIKKSYIAATLGDSIWLINTSYLKRSFKGDVKKLNNYAPVFFNDKVAYLTYVGYGDNLSLKTVLFGNFEDVDYSELMDYYYIDFFQHKVRKVTPEVLSELLEDYHTLQMRYEGMKDYKKRYIIEDYFMKYIDRASQDIMRPYILDLVKN